MFRAQIDKEQKQKIAKRHDGQDQPDEGNWIAHQFTQTGKSIFLGQGGGLESSIAHAIPSVLLFLTALLFSP
jgi:hypothetical protein